MPSEPAQDPRDIALKICFSLLAKSNRLNFLAQEHVPDHLNKQIQAHLDEVQAIVTGGGN
jgi:hypothetical protein